MNFAVPYRKLQKRMNLIMGIIWLFLGAPDLLAGRFAWWPIVISLAGILYLYMAYRMYTKNYIEVTSLGIIKNGVFQTAKMSVAAMDRIENRRGIRLIFYAGDKKLRLIVGYLNEVTQLQQWISTLNKPIENV